MGVIYKARPDVVAYLVRSKKSDPSLTCRQLAALVRREFSLDISKSTINDVLRRHGIVRPRGGRRGFRIPEERKERLFGPRAAAGEGPPRGGPQPGGEACEAGGPSVGVLCPEILRIPTSSMEEDVYGSGRILLRFAHWFLSDTSLPQWFYPPEAMRDPGSAALLDAIILLPSFPAGSIRELRGDAGACRALAVVCGFRDEDLIDRVERLMSRADLGRGKDRLALELPQLLTEVAAVDVVLSDGGGWSWDGRMTTVVLKGNRSVGCVPLRAALRILDRMVLKNEDPLLFRFGLGQESGFFPILESATAVCEGSGVRFLRIVLRDEHDQEVAGFEFIPQRPRCFVMACEGDVDVFSGCWWRAGGPPADIEMSGQESRLGAVVVREGKVTAKFFGPRGKPFRIIEVRNEILGRSWMMVSNAAEDRLSVWDAVALGIGGWSGYFPGETGIDISYLIDQIINSSSIEHVVRHLYRIVEMICMRHIISKKGVGNEDWDRIASLPGHLVDKEKVGAVLTIPRGDPTREVLAEAVGRIWDARIRSFDGRGAVLSLSHSVVRTKRRA